MTDWKNTLAESMNSADISIVACIVAIVFFMKFNRHEGKNFANTFIGVCLGCALLLLVAFRVGVGIYTGFYVN